MTYLSIKCERGFTLLELLIALAIFSLVAVIAYRSLLSVVQVSERVEQMTQQLTQLQLTFQKLQQDVMQLRYRPIRNEYGDNIAAIQGTAQQFELTRAGWRNSLQQQRSQLQRVNYVLEGRTLWRSYWQVLDRTRDSQPLRTALLTDVTHFKLRFLDEHLEWHEEWQSSESKTEKTLQLKAVEVTLTVSHWGELTWLLPTLPAPQPNPKMSPPKNK
jgi:general secretion pathway protein J